jgi:homospermidine synthase
LAELHKAINAFPALPNGDKGATGIFEHGANPGLVSHLVKKALTDLTNALIADPAVDPTRKAALKDSLEKQQFNKLCQLTGTKVIHVAERDTQKAAVPKIPGEFVNTWSIAGFYEEGIAPVEIAWGTHEKHLPKGSHFHDELIESPWREALPEDAPRSPGHCIALSQPGMRSWARSYCPQDEGDFIGILMPHGECITMTDCLTVYDANG